MLRLFTWFLKRELEMISTHDKKEQSYQLWKMMIYKRRPSLLSSSLSIYCRNVSQGVLFPKENLDIFNYLLFIDTLLSHGWATPKRR